MNATLVLVENTSSDFYGFRLRYSLYLKNLGYEVYAIIPDDEL